MAQSEEQKDIATRILAVDAASLSKDVNYLQRDVYYLTQIVNRFDNAIEKIDQLNSSVAKMLTLHEEKINEIEKDLATHINDDKIEFKKHLDTFENIYKWKWLILGGMVVFMILTTGGSSSAVATIIKAIFASGAVV